jgi:hypothetical protein
MHGTVAGKGGAGPSFLVPTPGDIMVEFERDGSGAVSAARVRPERIINGSPAATIVGRRR